MQKLRLVPFSVHSAPYNMAADEFILSQPGTTLRFYGWTKPTLSFGRFDPYLEDIDLATCEKHQMELVKRLTGGKTVLHQYELTYAIVADIDLFSDSILQTYRMISQPLSDSLNQFGVNAVISPRRLRNKDSSICFREVSAYEIAVDGRKIVGSAQFRRSNRFLQHGSILLDLDWKLWKQVWKLPDDSTELEARITTFHSEAGKQLDREAFIRLFTQKLAETLKKEIVEQEFSLDEEARITDLMRKYQWVSNKCQEADCQAGK